MWMALTYTIETDAQNLCL